MQGLHCTHFLKHQYPSIPHLLFPAYPRTVCGLRVSAVLLFYTDQINRVHSSEEAPRNFTLAPCVVVERLEEKQRCTRAAVSEHAGSKPENNQGDCSRRNERSMKKRPKPAQPTYNGEGAFVIQLICAGVGPIHPVYSQPMSLATEAMPQTRLHFCHFPAVFFSNLPKTCMFD